LLGSKGAAARYARPVARPSYIAALGASLLAAAGAPAAGVAAPAGTFSGRITGPLPASGLGKASVRAYDVQTGALVRIATAGRSGGFKLRLPAGAYLVDAVSVRDRAVMSKRLVPLSLKAGQQRSGARLHLAAVTTNATSTTPTPQPDAGVAAAAGVTTYRFDDLAGPTHSLATLGRGLPSLVAADVLGDETCSAIQLAGTRERTALSDTARLKRSPYFSRSQAVRRQLLAPQLAVTGTIAAGKDAAHAAFTVRIVDLSAGLAVDTLQGAVRRSGRGLFTDERRIAAALTERICRRPRSYSVALKIDGRGDYSAYNSTARLASTAVAKAATQAPYVSWRGAATFTWTDNVFRSRVTGCPASNVRAGTGGWSANVTALAGAQVRVDIDLTASEYTAYSKADFICQGKVGSITGAPGPLLTGTAPRTFTLPATGGTGTIAGGTTLAAGGGLLQTGTLTLAPVWGHALPGA
jgi:hypothetical protein